METMKVLGFKQYGLQQPLKIEGRKAVGPPDGSYD